MAGRCRSGAKTAKSFTITTLTARNPLTGTAEMVRPLLPVEVDRRIARIVRRNGVLSILALIDAFRSCAEPKKVIS